MNQLARDFAAAEVGSIFLYTNEAHPGEHYPHHTSMEQKLVHAAALRDRLHVDRPILVDALSGDCHRRFGSMPNMTWIFDSRGVPLYKSDWSDADSVRGMLDQLMALPERRRSGVRIAPFQVERMEWREADRGRFQKGLELSGPKAVEEFRKAFG
ncbi:MAG: hypothetical protein DHS20C21_13620 [Gemmatimonadota bacterium]|nr:MAG: hypothetical protein DHS20C21_13620 [Gemmatimonadota bacterium]